MIGIINNALNSLFAPLVAMGPIYTIASISIFVSFVFSLMYKVLVDQSKIRFLRSELKTIQEKINAARKKGDDKKLKDLWEKSMSMNNEQMMMNMKPMLVSMVFVMLILPWLAGTYGAVGVTLEDNSGEVAFANATHAFTLIDVSGTPAIRFEDSGAIIEEGESISTEGSSWQVEIIDDDGEKTVRFNKFSVKLPFSLPIYGSVLGWLGYYIIVSLPSTYLFRKLLGVE